MEPNPNVPQDNQPAAPAEPQAWSQNPVTDPEPAPVTQPVQPAYTSTTEAVQPLSPQPVATQPANATPELSKGLAIAALVVGIIAILTGPLGILLGLVAIILGGISLKKRLGGKGMAIAGVATGAAAIIIGGVILALFMFVFHAVQNKGAATTNYNDAVKIAEVAEKYKADHISEQDSFALHYPSYSDLIKDTSLDSGLKTKLHEGDAKSVTNNKPIAYESCSEGGTFYYWTGRGDAGSFPIGSPEKC